MSIPDDVRSGVDTASPPKVFIQDLISLERLDAQFNPTSVEDVVHVEWVKNKVPGLSQRKYQYDYTDNFRFSLELVFDAFFTGDVTPMEEAKRFLRSICYRKENGDFPRVLVSWPNFFSLVCVVDGDVKTKTTRFNRAGAPTYVTITVPFSEIRDERLTSEEVRDYGEFRGGATAQKPDGIPV